MIVEFVSGYTRDLPHRRTQMPVGALLAKYESTPIPDAFSLRAYEAHILDQGQTSSCGGAGSAQGVFTAAHAQGSSLGFIPSPAGIYGTTRATARANAGISIDATLTDSGVMPSDVMTALARWGVRPIQSPTPDGRFYDLWSAADLRAAGLSGAPNVDVDPKLEEIEKGALKLIAGEYRIEESDSLLVATVKQALYVAKAPIGDGTFVDSQVMRYKAGGPPVGAPNLSDPNGGGHWTCIVGYKPDPVLGGTLFEVVNSWGSDYGDAGHFWGTEAWLKACTDLYPWTVRKS